MRDLSKPLSPTFGDEKKKPKTKKPKNKNCTPTNMDACEGVGGPGAKGPKGKKGGPKKKPKGKMFGSGMSGKKREAAYYRSQQMRGAYASSGGTKNKSRASTQDDRRN